MKVTNIILSLLFVSFGWVQYNDPDPFLWISLYLFIAAVCAFAAFGKFNKYILLGGIAICIIWTLMLLPEFINWVNMGMPTIVDSMKVEEPHIEYTREFLGLFICIFVLGFQYKKMPKE